MSELRMSEPRMSEPRASEPGKGELLPRPALLSRCHADARRLARAGAPARVRIDLLFGSRGIKRPMVALVTKQNLGPCRHALAQMVVAGVMTVHPPLGPGQAAPVTTTSAPRVLTFTPPPRGDPDTGRPPSSARPPVASGTRPPAPAPARGAAPAPKRAGSNVTYERSVLEDFEPPPTKDD